MFETFVAALVFDLTKSAVGTFFGFLVARYLLKKIEQKRFGGWNVRVLNPDGTTAMGRPVSVQKIQQILDDAADLSVYIKGLASPYAWLNVDPCVGGLESGLLKIDRAARTVTVDLGKNPEKKPR